MAAEMVRTVMKAEAQAREIELQARKNAEKLISDAEIQAGIILKSSIEQAHSQANIIITDSEYSATGVIKQAEKLAELREKKSIADTEKQYETAIDMIFDVLTK